ncbi:MAG: polysaccharide deacetylase family protein [bacterium]
MIGIYKNWDSAIDNEITYVFEILLNTIGISYVVSSNHKELIKTNPLLIINYGDSLPNCLEKTGIIVNIPCSQEFISLRSLFKSKLDKDKTQSYWQEIVTLENKFLSEILKKITYLDAENLCFDNDILSTRQQGNVTIIDIKIDIIASTFYLVTCQEQILSLKRDIHDRFLSSYSMLDKLVETPIVSIYLTFLQQIFLYCAKRQKEVLVQKWYWPEGRISAVCLTHDVDDIQKWKLWEKGIREIIVGTLKCKYQWIQNGILEIYNCLRYEDPYWNFEKIVRLEKQYGYLSSFYLLADNSTYKIRNKKLKNIVKEISQQGFEIGLHASYDSYNRHNQVLCEKKRVEKISSYPINGIRGHYLRFNPEVTWQVYTEAGFEYDTTVGYADHEGFRTGCSFPLYLYHIKENKKLPLIELPLIIMDTTLFTYQKYSPDEALTNIKRLLEMAKNYNGLGIILWHQQGFNEKENPGRERIYEEILEWLSENKIYVRLCQDIIQWWKRREAVRIIKEDRFEYRCISDILIERDFSFKLSNINLKNLAIEGVKCDLHPLSETECMLITKEATKEFLIKV